MTSPFVSEFLAKGLAVAALAIVAAAIAGRRSPYNRCVVWTGCTLALILLPAAVVLGPDLTLLDVGIAPWVPATAPPALLAAVWAAGLAIGLVAMVRSHLSLLSIRRRTRSCDEKHAQSLLEACARAQGLRRRPELRVGDHGITPFTAGWRRPWICLPAEAAQWPDELLESVLAHECAHVRLGHWPLRRLSMLTAALHWPNPLVWALHLAFARDQELACDDRAVRSGIARLQYASALVSVARRVRSLVAAPAMAGHPTLRGRITRILQPQSAAHAWGWRSALGVLVVFLIAGSAWGAAGVRVDAALAGRPPIAREEHAARGGGLFGPLGLLPRDADGRWFRPLRPDHR